MSKVHSMTATAARLPAQPTTVFKLGSATLLLAAAALWAGQAQAQAQPATSAPPAPGAQHAAHHRMAPGMGMPGGMIPERLLDEVGASAEQKSKLREIFKSARDDLRPQREGGQALHQQMLALLAAPKVDAAAAESLRQQQLARHDASSKRMLQAMLDAQAVLTPEQRQKLAERMAARHDRMERHHPRRAPEAPKG